MYECMYACNAIMGESIMNKIKTQNTTKQVKSDLTTNRNRCAH